MPKYRSEQIRNIALVGQTGCGKTTLIESMLACAGVIASPGSVERGTTVCDFDPLEKEYQHSLSASIASFDHDNIHLSVIDTPGLPDFIGQAMGVFPAVETVAVVIDCAAGIEPLARRMLEWAQDNNLCRMIIINKIDSKQANLEGLVAELRDEFGPECLPINLPANGASSVVDCFYNPGGESDFSSIATAHTEIIDQVVEVDEELMTLYLEQGEELNPEQLHEAFEQSLRSGHLVPICFTSASAGTGVAELLALCEKLMPAPCEGNPRPFMRGEGESEQPFTVLPDPDAHVVAHVFKVLADPYVGKLGLFRVHQGTINRNCQLYVGDGRKPIKVTHLFRLQGQKQIAVNAALPGDICAMAKIEELHFDAVLHDSHDEDYLHMKPLPFPIPVFGLAIDAGSKGDDQRLSTSLQRIVEEDPCLKVEHNSALNETVLRGLGDLHLRLALEKMEKRFNVTAKTRPPKVPYRETISSPAKGHHRHKKQTGGAGQFGEVFMRIKPLERGAGFSFVDEVKGGTVPSQFISAIEKGVHQVMETGAVAGYPLQDLEVTLYDGKHHAVDSKEFAFVAAGKRAFLEAITKAKPQVLEPMVNLDLTVPGGAMGSVTGDLMSKRGHVHGSSALPGGMLSIKAQAPLSEINHYADELRSMTEGQGSYTLEFSHYQKAPGSIQKSLIEAFKPHHDES